MRDLPGYTRSGLFQWPQEIDAQPEPPRVVDHSLDNLDAAAYKVRLDAYFAAATVQLDGPTLSADERQWAAGYKHGLGVALRLLDAELRRPTTIPTAVSEEPHS